MFNVLSCKKNTLQFSFVLTISISGETGCQEWGTVGVSIVDDVPSTHKEVKKRMSNCTYNA